MARGFTSENVTSDGRIGSKVEVLAMSDFRNVLLEREKHGRSLSRSFRTLLEHDAEQLDWCECGC